MRKTWVKKEHIYYKPFYKQKLKMGLLIVLVMGVIFITYQLFYINQLQITTSPQHTKATTNISPSIVIVQKSQIPIVVNSEKYGHLRQVIRGIRKNETNFYKPNANGMFTCIQTKHQIPFERVNDNYCDCIEDGSDEPETNACPHGVFHCTHQMKNFQMSIPNSRINDGICDCCDGSDEWLKSIKDEVKKCPNICI